MITEIDGIEFTKNFVKWGSKEQIELKFCTYILCSVESVLSITWRKNEMKKFFVLIGKG